MNRRMFTVTSLLVAAAFPLAVAAQKIKMVTLMGRITSVSTGSITLADKTTMYLNRPTPDFFPRTEIEPNGTVLAVGQRVVVRGMRMANGTINALKISILGAHR